MSHKKVNCANCGTSVSKATIPNRANGNCWRCETNRLEARIKVVESEHDGMSAALYKTLSRLGVILFHKDDELVGDAIEAWLGDVEEGVDLVEPPPEVDELFEQVERVSGYASNIHKN